MPNYQERGQEGKENRNALRLSFPRGQTVAKDFENLSAEKRGDFRNILPHFSKPPTCAPRDLPRLPVPPGAGVQGLAISPCKQTKPDTRCTIKAEVQVLVTKHFARWT